MRINSLIKEIGLDDLHHKAVIDISEEGKADKMPMKRKYDVWIPEIDTWNTVENDTFGVDGGIAFHCDRPFVYAIYNRNIGEILFAGIFRGPK